MARGIDHDLEQALKDSEGVDEEPVIKPAGSPEGKDPHKKKGSPALVVALLAMVGAVVAFVLVGFNDASIYAMPANEAVAQGSKLDGRKLRVDGELVPGSLKDNSSCDWTFVIKASDTTMPVHYKKCELPDTFRDRPEGGVMVTVEGELKDGTFQASQVMAKCTSKYEAENAQYDPKTHELILPDGRRVPAPGAKPSSETIR
jgi:cytochrome c-type biogenesis protein CcmE